VTFNEVVEGVGKTIDGAGVAFIVVGALAATVIAGTRARVAKLICTGVPGSSSAARFCWVLSCWSPLTSSRPWQ